MSLLWRIFKTRCKKIHKKPAKNAGYKAEVSDLCGKCLEPLLEVHPKRKEARIMTPDDLMDIVDKLIVTHCKKYLQAVIGKRFR